MKYTAAEDIVKHRNLTIVIYERPQTNTLSVV